MNNDQIKEITKDKTDRHLDNVWAYLGFNPQSEMITEEFAKGRSMRTNPRGKVMCTLSELEKVKKDVRNSFARVFESCIIREYQLDEVDRTTVIVYNVEIEVRGGFVIKGDLIISHYLNMIPNKMLGKQREVMATVMHEFVATLIDIGTAGTRHFYVGNITNLVDRIRKRAYAHHHVAHLKETFEKFGI